MFSAIPTDINSPGTNQQKTSCSFADVVERVIQGVVRKKQQSPGELLRALYDEYYLKRWQ